MIHEMINYVAMMYAIYSVEQSIESQIHNLKYSFTYIMFNKIAACFCCVLSGSGYILGSLSMHVTYLSIYYRHDSFISSPR